MHSWGMNIYGHYRYSVIARDFARSTTEFHCIRDKWYPLAMWVHV